MKLEKVSVKGNTHSGQPVFVTQQGSQEHQSWGKSNKKKPINSRTWEKKQVQDKKIVKTKGIK